VHDPVATASAARVLPDLTYVDSPVTAATGADLLVHLTDWEEYRLIDPEVLGSVASQRRVIDTRAALDEQRWRSAGWAFHALGRS
jgi:UDPglucose 6-dehydrogenase